MRVFSAKRVSALLMSTLLTGVATLPSLGAPANKALTASVSTDKQANANSANGLVGKAYVQMRSGNWAFAIGELCNALRFQRNNPLARRYLCYSLLQAGAPRDAISQLDALSQLKQAIPFDLCMRGDALQQLGESDKAVEALKAALQMDAKSDYIRTKLIEALQSYGKFQEASAICAEGYYGATTAPLRERYHETFNVLQQQRAILAQRNLGIQIAASPSYPMMPQQPAVQTAPALAQPAAATAKSGDKAAAAAADADNDDDTATASTAAKTTK
jgi:tetratricopeptide (TPR) repeat protein